MMQVKFFEINSQICLIRKVVQTDDTRRLSVKAAMGNRERNEENDGHAENQGGNVGNAGNQGGNAGNRGGYAESQGGNDGNQGWNAGKKLK